MLQPDRLVARRRRTETGKIVVSDNLTLDGVIQGPAGDEGFRAGGWALLLGRRSYSGEEAIPRGRREGTP